MVTPGGSSGFMPHRSPTAQTSSAECLSTFEPSAVFQCCPTADRSFDVLWRPTAWQITDIVATQSYTEGWSTCWDTLQTLMPNPHRLSPDINGDTVSSRG